MFTAVPAGTQPRRAPVVQEPSLPAVHEGVIVTAFATASASSEVRFLLCAIACKILRLAGSLSQLYCGQTAATLLPAMQSDFVPVVQHQVRHGVAADQGRRSHMEDATVAVPDFRSNLSQEIAAQAPDANCFYGVMHPSHHCIHPIMQSCSRQSQPFVAVVPAKKV